MIFDGAGSMNSLTPSARTLISQMHSRTSMVSATCRLCSVFDHRYFIEPTPCKYPCHGRFPALARHNRQNARYPVHPTPAAAPGYWECSSRHALYGENESLPGHPHTQNHNTVLNERSGSIRLNLG